MSKKEMKKELFSVDFGNKGAKMHSDKGEYCYPSKLHLATSRFKDWGNSENISLDTLAEYSTSLHKDKFYIWGEAILNAGVPLVDTMSLSNRYSNEYFKAGLQFALGRLAYDYLEDGEEIYVALSVGLPSSDNVEKVQHEYANFIKQPFTVTINDKTMTIHVTHVLFNYQFIGTAYDQAFDENGKLVNLEITQNAYGIVDLGGLTALFDELINMNPALSQIRVQTPDGCNKLYRMIEQNENCRIEQITSNEIQQCLREGSSTGNYIVNRSKFQQPDIAEAVKEELREYSDFTVQRTREVYQDKLKIYKGLIYTGGTMNILDQETFKNTLEQNLQLEVIIPDNPEFSNVRGFHKFAKYRNMVELPVEKTCEVSK